MSKLINRRHFLKLSALTGASIALASCAPGQPPPTVIDPAATKKFKKTLLTVPSWWGPHESSGAEASFNGSFKEKTGIGVKYDIIVQTNFNPAVFAKLSSDDPYDAVTFSADFLPTYLEKGALQPLESFIARDNFDINNIVPSALEQWTYDGKIYGLTADMGSFHAYFNLDFFEKAGITPPKPTEDWTWDQLLEYAKKLTIKTGDQVTQYGFAATGVENHFELWPNMNGTFVFDKKLKTCLLDDPKAIEAFQFYQDLIYKEGVALRPGSVKTTAADLFLAGQLAIFIGGTWQVGYLRSKKADMKFRWDVGLLPKGPSADKLIIPNFTAGWAMPKNVKDPDASWEAMKWYVSDQFGKDVMFKSLSGLPTTKTLLDAAPYSQWPENPPQGLTKEFYGKILELGSPKRRIRYDIGSDILAAINTIQLIYSNEKTAKEALTKVAADVNTLLKDRPWNKT